MDTAKSIKANIRKKIKKKILLLSNQEKNAQSDVILEKLFNLPVFQKSKRISTYLSIENEVNTQPIVEKILGDPSKKCFIPRYSKSTMEMVKLQSMDDWETLPLTKWNIKQPLLSEKRENALETGGLDLIIIPGVAFTSDGFRLGHGGGYYDKFLNQIKAQQSTPPVTVALAFKEQIVNDLPTHDHDAKIDIILYAN